MLGVYSLLIKLDLSVPGTMLVFGIFVSVSMALVILKHQRNQREYDSTHLIGEEKASALGPLISAESLSERAAQFGRLFGFMAF